MIGNAWGNGFGALRSHLTGKPIQEFSFFDALGVVVGPIVMIPAILVGRLIKLKGLPKLLKN